ncbi:hypothetical protein PILCRDRAFT_82369 [Piloderma croceum F 1598]|uniref:Protein kinase domain-containing protein n=1 Tax=Piloderma croceum (strain F 1598) TaxID=765440 RepID=A0A0C3B3M5_PILCF|nr:hypothetical protein PILCRDRAFT_82369 [Piloderma croceum F 1598]
MLDEVAICAQLRVIQKDPFRYKAILALRAERAQHLLNCLQTRSDDPALHPDQKRFSVVLLIELAHRSGLYPECLVQKDIQIIGNHPMAGGSFGDVWKGLMKGQLVAVKVVRIFEASDRAQLLKASKWQIQIRGSVYPIWCSQAFSYEAVTWRQLSHPNVLPFYGIHHLYDNPARVCLVSPWMGHGRVTQFLKRFPTTNRVHLILDIAEGLEYLHNLKPFVIHGDLKGANILVTASGRACLADFGLAIVIDSQVNKSPSVESAGTPRWQAPELLQGDFGDVGHCNSSRESDIYAFACVCYELISGNLPFHEIKMPYQIMVAVTKGQRPSRPSHDYGMIHGLDNLWTLIEACWATHPANRLTASQIVEAIRSWPDHGTDRRAPQQWDDVSAAIMAVFEDVASNLSQDNLPALVESNPVRWQSINTGLIISAIHNLTKLSRSNALECSKIVQDVGVYQVSCFVRDYDFSSSPILFTLLSFQRLLAYTFAHMRLCGADDQ